MTASGSSPRFLTLTDVAEILNTSTAQVYALVRRQELPAIKIGGRGQWRVEVTELEAFIQRMYADTQAYLRSSEAELEIDALLDDGQPSRKPASETNGTTRV